MSHMMRMTKRDMPFSSMTMDEERATGRLPRKNATRSETVTPSCEADSTPATSHARIR
jgi:hypothetical protein